MKGDIKIPARFWQRPYEEYYYLFENGGWLSSDHCAEIWRMEGRTDKPPLTMQLFVKREDVLRIWPPKVNE